MISKCLLGMTTLLFEWLKTVVINRTDDQIELDCKYEHKQDDSDHIETIEFPYLMDLFDLIHAVRVIVK